MGSTSVGLHVYEIAAAHGKRVQAQTEAKNHGIVLEDAALERSAAGIVNSTFGCAGMRCMALPSICVQESVADEFVGYLVKAAKALVIGAAYDPSTELGPVVSAGHRDFVLRVDREVDRRGRRAHRRRPQATASRGEQNGFFVGPTIFDHVTPEMSCGWEEVFGPVHVHQAHQGLRRGSADRATRAARQRFVHLHRERLLRP